VQDNKDAKLALPAAAMSELKVPNYDPFSVVAMELFAQELQGALPPALRTNDNMTLLMRLREMFLEMTYVSACARSCEFVTSSCGCSPLACVGVNSQPRQRLSVRRAIPAIQLPHWQCAAESRQIRPSTHRRSLKTHIHIGSASLNCVALLAGEVGADVSAIVRERLELHTEHQRKVDALDKQQEMAKAAANRLAKELAEFEAAVKLQKTEDDAG
jgi:hypothetical protein